MSHTDATTSVCDSVIVDGPLSTGPFRSVDPVAPLVRRGLWSWPQTVASRSQSGNRHIVVVVSSTLTTKLFVSRTNFMLETLGD